MFDVENLKEFAKDLWQAMLDHWIATLIIVTILTGWIFPPGILLFLACKLVDTTRKNRKY